MNKYKIKNLIYYKKNKKNQMKYKLGKMMKFYNNAINYKCHKI